MLAETTIQLEARNPATNRMRGWSVELGQDLLGMWIVDVEFGRIRSRGRRLRRVFTDQPTAHAYMGLGLRRRATAPARIGIVYRWVRASFDALAMLAKVGIEAHRSA
jgi:hypothetical protein